MRVAVQNLEKFTKTPYFVSSRLFKVIEIDTAQSSSPVLVMISSMSMLSATVFTLDELISVK